MGAIDPDQNNMTPAFDGDLAGHAERYVDHLHLFLLDDGVARSA
jgi:hypothetical protein